METDIPTTQPYFRYRKVRIVLCCIVGFVHIVIASYLWDFLSFGGMMFPPGEEGETSTFDIIFLSAMFFTSIGAPLFYALIAPISIRTRLAIVPAAILIVVAYIAYLRLT